MRAPFIAEMVVRETDDGGLVAVAVELELKVVAKTVTRGREDISCAGKEPFRRD